MKYFDTFSKPGYHSAFLTSFTFDGDAFESIVLNRLRNSGCNNVHVVNDFHIFKENLNHYGPPSQAGLRYHLALHKRQGAFHPKLALQFGKDKARLLVSSANLTFTGLAGNLELVDEIVCEGAEDPSQPLLASAANFIVDCFPDNDDWFKRGFRKALDDSPWFNIDHANEQIEDTATGLWGVVHTSKPETAIQQISQLVGDDPIIRINILSPFWDEKLEALWFLSERLNHPEIRIGIETERGQFPVHSLGRFSNLSVHALNRFAKSRSIHAKLFVLEGRDHDHVVSGSMNCSAAALFSTINRPTNAEFGIYRRVRKGQALKQIKLEEFFKTEVKLTEIKAFVKSEDSKEGQTQSIEAQMTLTQKTLMLTLDPNEVRKPDSVSLSGPALKVDQPIIKFSTNKSKGQWTAKVPTQYASVNVGIIAFGDGTSSEPIVICNVMNLRENGRSPNTQKIEKLLNRLNRFENENLDIIDILLELQAAQKAHLKPTGQKKVPGEREVKAKPQATNTVVSYDEFMEFEQDQPFPYEQRFSGSAHRYSSDVTNALNELLGVIAPQLAPMEKLDIDLSTTEPPEPKNGNDEEGDSNQNEPPNHEPQGWGPLPADLNQEDHSDNSHQISAYRHNTADKLVAAVERYCKQIAGKSAKPIDITKLTHGRALVQVILSHTKPLKTIKKGDSKPVLPTIDTLHKKEGWPRLIGRVVQAITSALKKEAANDFSESSINGDHRIIDSLAVIVGSGELAFDALVVDPSSGALIEHMDKAVKNLGALISAYDKNINDTESRYSGIKKCLIDKFRDSAGPA